MWLVDDEKSNIKNVCISYSMYFHKYLWKKSHYVHVVWAFEQDNDHVQSSL